ncbi:MAG: cytochrome c3 family protein [Gemmatimonadota bacterium]
MNTHGPSFAKWRSWTSDSAGTVRRAILGFASILVVILVSLSFLTRQPAVGQPIAFNHLKHTEELSLNCEFCHKYVRSGAHAGLPGAETCSLCHRAVQGTSEEAARVTELLTAGGPILFNKLFRLPDHVFYTHRRHAGIGELECQTCHGEIAGTESPPPRPLVNVSMDFCIDCHEERDQTVDCNACHR